MNIIKSIISPLVNFIYPPVCIVCNELLPENETKVCSKCWESIPIITKEHPLYIETRNKISAENHIANLISLFVFEKDGAFQQIAHALKYQEFKSLGVELGKLLAKKILEWNIPADVVIPIPLHKIKYRERGYNQSDYIANGIAEVLHIPIHNNIIRRKRNTQTQTQLNMFERKKNMEGAFEIIEQNSYKIKGKTCLLVDDVITTGATTNSCAKVLISAGSKLVIAASTALAK